jgi:hypothetical protein
MRRRLVVLLACVTLASCGSDGGDGAADGTTTTGDTAEPVASQAWVDAVVTLFTRADAPGDPVSSMEEAACIARRFVTAIDVEALEEAGVTPDDLVDSESLADFDVEPPADAEAEIVAAMRDCGLDSVRAGFARQFGIADAGDQCIEALVGTDALSVFAAALFLRGEDAGGRAYADVLETVEPACAERLLGGIGLLAQGFDEALSECVVDRLDDEVSRDIIVAAFRSFSTFEVDAPEQAQALMEAATACG